jgi:hypothetical protein
MVGGYRDLVSKKTLKLMAIAMLAASVLVLVLVLFWFYI